MESCFRSDLLSILKSKETKCVVAGTEWKSFSSSNRRQWWTDPQKPHCSFLIPFGYGWPTAMRELLVHILLNTLKDSIQFIRTVHPSSFLQDYPPPGQISIKKKRETPPQLRALVSSIHSVIIAIQYVTCIMLYGVLSWGRYLGYRENPCSSFT